MPAPENVARSRALGEPALAATERIAAFYESLRDDFAPRRPIWITETAEAACGGNRWAATFLDAFRYVDQLGRLARRGVQVVFHNTFSASDYGLVDEASLQPRPNYWAALLWRRLMGTTVLDAGSSPAPGLRLYAHCLAGRRGGGHRCRRRGGFRVAGVELAAPGLELEAFVERGKGRRVLALQAEVLGAHRKRHVALDRDEFARLRQPVEGIAQVLPHRTADLAGVGNDGRERIVLREPLHRGLRSDLVHAGHVVDGVTDQREVVEIGRAHV